MLISDTDLDMENTEPPHHPDVGSNWKMIYGLMIIFGVVLSQWTDNHNGATP